MANYTRKAIMKNFEEMLIEMPFDKITVSALVERCDISSNTFYYHYRDIYDLLEAWLALKKEKYVNSPRIQNDWPEELKIILCKMQENSSLIYHVSNSISRERLERFVFGSIKKQFYEILHRRLKEYGISDEVIKDLAAFYCYSILGFLLDFLWRHMEIDVNSTVDQLAITFSGVTEHVLAKETNKSQ